MKPRRPCSVPGCPRIAERSGRCAVHAVRERGYDRQRGTSAERGYGAAWRQRRAEFLAEHPVCIDCGAPATDADHEVPRLRGGSDADENLRARCHRCHSRKTAQVDGGFGNGQRGEGRRNR